MKLYVYYSVFVLFLVTSVNLFAFDAPFPDNELICSNIRDTDTSLRVKLLDAKSLTHNTKGYNEYEYKAVVLEVYKGSFKVGQEIKYNETREADLPPKLPLGEKVISLMQSKGAIWNIPDNGYAFDYEPGLGKRYKEQAIKCVQKPIQPIRQEASPD
ncbi:MAG: hypothetical protein ACD_73C00721G0003 [uncultured bacterium]|nr:MAG: hypothetical protein ACD_73C00721G0003 [uncultured bacterium]